LTIRQITGKVIKKYGEVYFSPLYFIQGVEKTQEGEVGLCFRNLKLFQTLKELQWIKHQTK
jgi:hypothetical protein